MQLTPLNFAEAEWLKDCEYDIENGLVVFLKVGQRLMEIRANRLYRATHATFEDYCLERWNISRPRVYQLMAAAETSENLSTIVDTPQPTHESQVRPLSGLEPEQQREAWKEATTNNPQPTAGAIKTW